MTIASRCSAVALGALMAVAGLSPAARAGDCPEVSAASAEATFLSLANASRGSHVQLASNETIARMAREHSALMADARDIFHSETYIPAVLDMGATAAAENVGVGCTVAAIHEALMTSAPHRRNLLADRFTQVGIGVVVGHQGAIYVTQEFATLPSAAEEKVAPPAPTVAPAESEPSAAPVEEPEAPDEPVLAAPRAVGTVAVDAPEPSAEAERASAAVSFRAAGSVRRLAPAPSRTGLELAGAAAVATALAALVARRRGRPGGTWEVR